MHSIDELSLYYYLSEMTIVKADDFSMQINYKLYVNVYIKPYHKAFYNSKITKCRFRNLAI